MLTWFNFASVIISTRCVQAVFCLPLDESGEWRLSDAPSFVCGSTFKLCASPHARWPRHRRRHVYCVRMGVPVLKTTASPARPYPRNRHAVGDAEVQPI